MKRNQLKLSIFLLPLIAAIGLLVTACNSDDEPKIPCYKGEIKGSDDFGNTYIITTSAPPDSPYKEIGSDVVVSVKTAFIIAHGLDKGDIIEFQILSYTLNDQAAHGPYYHARYMCDIKLCE